MVIEVMTEAVDRRWWHGYATELATRFGQEELVVRAIAFDSLNATPADDSTGASEPSAPR